MQIWRSSITPNFPCTAPLNHLVLALDLCQPLVFFQEFFLLSDLCLHSSVSFRISCVWKDRSHFALHLERHVLSNGEVPSPTSELPSPDPSSAHHGSLGSSFSSLSMNLCLHLQSGDHNRICLTAFSQITNRRSGNSDGHPLSATEILDIISIIDPYCPVF